MVGIYGGDGKPPLNDYLSKFINELLYLLENGININGNLIKIHFGYCVCDTPARSFIKGISTAFN